MNEWMIQKSFNHIEYVIWGEQDKLFPLTRLPTLSYKSVHGQNLQANTLLGIAIPVSRSNR